MSDTAKIRVPDLKWRPTGRSFRIGGEMADAAGPKRYPFVVPNTGEGGVLQYTTGDLFSTIVLLGITEEGDAEPIPMSECDVYGLDGRYAGRQAVTAVYDGRAYDLLWEQAGPK